MSPPVSVQVSVGYVGVCCVEVAALLFRPVASGRYLGVYGECIGKL